MKLKIRKPSIADLCKAAVATILYVAFLAWVDAWWGLIVVPFILDAYLTRWIPWTWWKDLENPVARIIMSWVDAIVFALVAVYFFNIYFFPRRWLLWHAVIDKRDHYEKGCILRQYR